MPKITQHPRYKCEIGGETADTQRMCHGVQMIVDIDNFVTHTVLSATEEKAHQTLIKELKVEEDKLALEQANKEIHKAIGEEKNVITGKKEVNPAADTSAEEAKIASLTSQLQ